jgi:peptide chain release factor subunit 1
MEDVERLMLKRTVDSLRSEGGSVTEMVTLYVPPHKAITDVVQRLRGEVSEAGNIKNRVNRAGVTDSLTAVLNRLKTYSSTPQNGLAAFAGGNRLEVFEPPEPVAAYFYRCGAGFVLDPLEEMLESKDVFGMIVIDRGGVSIGWLRGTRIDMALDIESRVPGKHDAGGQSQHRFERQTEHLAHEFFVKAGEKANGIFLPALDKLAGIIVGGPGQTKRQWVDGEFMDYRLRQKILQPLFETGYLSDQGLRELSARASDTVAGRALAREREAVASFLNAIPTGMVAYGPENVREAVRNGRVGVLLVSEAIPDAPEIITAGRATGAKIIVVSDGSDEGRSFHRGFGGVGALLRYRA